jgi:MFS superfamily sulfate permease-like transporter
MADDVQKVNTPDGREWLVTVEGRKRTMKETREAPFFWAHVIVTAIIAGVMIYIFRHNTGILWILVVATFAVWAVGFLGSTFGAMIRADTQGPPPEHRLWKVTRRSARKRAVQDVIAAIGRGQLTAEPPHTRLEEI